VVAENLLECDVSDSIDQSVINLQSTDFELFKLEPKAVLDLGYLSRRWKELQAMTHPDRFASQGASATRVAMQYSIRVNEAYQRLRAPLTRFAYLCELHGAPIDAESNTAMPIEFLTQQMQWREDLDDATSPHQVESLQAEVDQILATLEQDCIKAIDANADFAEAAKIVRSMMFVNRFQIDIDNKADLLDRH